MKKSYVNSYEAFTTKTTLIFSRRMIVSTWLKHVLVIEDCDNVIFIATSISKLMLMKMWDLTSKLAKSLLKVRNLVELFLIDVWQTQLWVNMF